MSGDKPQPLSPADILRIEAEGQVARDKLYEEGKHNLTTRCAECGAVGSLEEVEGVLRCLDCDETVAAVSPMGGLGRN